VTDKYKKLLLLDVDHCPDHLLFIEELRQALSNCVAVIDVLEGALQKECVAHYHTGIYVCRACENLDEARKLLETKEK
jgi:hypothetical protein